MNELEHDWCNQQLATYLADGLTDSERSRFEAHARECDICAHDLDDARGIESSLKDLFAEVSPAEDFGDRVVGRLRQVGLRRRVHPMVRRVAVAAAAAAVVGGMGYIGERSIRDGKLLSPEQIAANLREAGQGAGIYPQAAQSVPTTLPSAASVDARIAQQTRDYILFSARDNLAAARSALAAGGPDDAQSAIERARVARNLQPALLSPDELRKLDADIASIQTAVDQARPASADRRSALASAAAENARTGPEERKRTVDDLITQTNQLITTGKYDQAVAVLDHVLTLDPNNQYARNTRPLVEDRAIIRNQRDSRERFDQSVARQFNQAEGRVKTVPVTGELNTNSIVNLDPHSDFVDSFNSQTSPSNVSLGGALRVNGVPKMGTGYLPLQGGGGWVFNGPGDPSLGRDTGMATGSLTPNYGITNTGGRTAGTDGVITIAGALAYTGSTTVQSGVLRESGKFAGSSTVTNGITNTGGGSGNLVYSGERASAISGASSLTVNGILNGSGGLTKAGAGTFTSNGGALDSEVVVWSGGTTRNTVGSFGNLGADLTTGGSQDISVNGNTRKLAVTGGTAQPSGPTALSVNTSNGFTKAGGGVLGITNSNTGFSGGMTVTGGTLNLGGNVGAAGISKNLEQLKDSVITNNSGVSSDVIQSFKPGEYGMVVDATVAGPNRLAKVPMLGDVAVVGEAFRRQAQVAGNAPADDRLRSRRADEQLDRGTSSSDGRAREFNRQFERVDDSPAKYTISGTSTLTLDSGLSVPAGVLQGSHAINAPARDLKTLAVQTAAGSSISFGGTVVGAGTLSSGAGSASFTRLNFPSGTINVQGGSAAIGQTPAVAMVPVIGEGGQPTAIVQGFIKVPAGPNPTAAIERTELALANTMQLQPATQPSQGGAVVVAQAVPAGQQAPQPAPAPMVQVRRVIRDGVMEFEVDSFDSSFAVVSKITAEEGGFIVAADSDRLQNGKVRGTITVRVPPDNLDTLILKLRALGELKSQKLGSKDISKEYTDLESELRAGRAMEERLLEMIRTAQGEVKDLLEAEKELANWRIRLEKIQGQMNYYNNLVSLATLTINAYEKDIRTPASATQSEEINAGIEAEDVDGARTAALKAIDDVKGRIVESSLQQMNAGQFAAKIVADVAPENAGQVVDRLRQIGRVARLDSQKKQTTGAGQTTPAPSVQPKVEQAPTRLIVSIYNLANVAPRLTTNLNLAGDDVETVYRGILKRVSDAGGRVVSSNLNRQDANQITGTIQFEVKTADADAVLNDIRQPVQVLRLNVTENPDTANVTSTKQGFTVQIIPTAQVTPRLTTNLNLAAEDVEATYSSILNRIRETGGRVIVSNLNRQDATQAIGTIQFEVKSTEADALLNELRAKVQVLTLNVTENTGAANVTGLKQGFSMQIIPTAQVNPREIRSLAVQTSAVDEAIQKVTSATVASGGRVLESSMSQDEGGAMRALIALEVPLNRLDSVADVAKAQGKVRTAEASRNTQVPEGPLSRARINLTIGTGETIVPQTGGFWDTIRGGLSTSVKGLLWSLQLIIIGLCLVGPWALLGWGGMKWMKRNRRMKSEPAT